MSRWSHSWLGLRRVADGGRPEGGVRVSGLPVPPSLRAGPACGLQVLTVALWVHWTPRVDGFNSTRDTWIASEFGNFFEPSLELTLSDSRSLSWPSSAARLSRWFWVRTADFESGAWSGPPAPRPTPSRNAALRAEAAAQAGVSPRGSVQLEKAFIAAGPPRRFESLVNVRRSGSADVESEPARPATRRLTYRNWQAKQLERLSLAVDTDLDTNSGSGSGHRCPRRGSNDSDANIQLAGYPCTITFWAPIEHTLFMFANCCITLWNVYTRMVRSWNHSRDVKAFVTVGGQSGKHWYP